MKGTEILKTEHRVIEQVLGCLEAMADLAVAHGRLDGESARAALDFLRNFADRCHHGKEENHLFPMMEERGFVREGGPTGVMLFEHEQGRTLLRRMEQEIPAAEQGDARAVDTFAAAARTYNDLLRNHIFKEDARLFPMADFVFNADDQENLLARFAHVEHAEMGDGTHERYVALADRLAERFHVPKAVVAHCCCHGKH